MSFVDKPMNKMTPDERHDNLEEWMTKGLIVTNNESRSGYTIVAFGKMKQLGAWHKAVSYRGSDGALYHRTYRDFKANFTSTGMTND